MKSMSPEPRFDAFVLECVGCRVARRHNFPDALGRLVGAVLKLTAKARGATSAHASRVSTTGIKDQ